MENHNIDKKPVDINYAIPYVIDHSYNNDLTLCQKLYLNKYLILAIILVTFIFTIYIYRLFSY
jgi:hypothetical protein